jgi:hypothetical protein
MSLRQSLASVSVVFVTLVWGIPHASANGVAANHEYAFRVSVPRGTPVCIARSGSHPHGFLWNLDRSDCHRNDTRNVVRAMGIWVEYNTAFVPSISKYLSPYCNGSRVVRDKSFSIASMQTAHCVHHHANGVVGIDVAAGRGIWLAASADREDNFPRIYYRAWLLTNRASYNRDFGRFRQFVKSIRLTPLPDVPRGAE